MLLGFSGHKATSTLQNRRTLRMNFYNHHIRSIFKSHSISDTFKFCAVLGAQGIRATGFKRAQGNAHCAKFESNTNRMTFEYAPNMMIVNFILFVMVQKMSIFSLSTTVK